MGVKIYSWSKILQVQNFRGINLFWGSIFEGSNLLGEGGQNFNWVKNFMGLKFGELCEIFLRSKFGVNIFWDLNFLGFNNFYGDSILGIQPFFWSKFLVKFLLRWKLWAVNIFWDQFFGVNIILGVKIFWRSLFFVWSKFIGAKMFW